MSTVSPSNPTVLPPQGNPRTLAAIVVVLTFVAGLMVGAVGDRFVLFAQHRLIPPRRDFVSTRIVDRLDRELHLTPSQRIAVTQILDKRHRQIEGLWDGVRPQVRTAMDATTREIEQVLTPDQRAKFAAMRSHPHRPMRHFFGRR